MLKHLLFSFLGLITSISTLQSQDYYIKHFTPYLRNIHQEVLENDDIIISGNVYSGSLEKLVVCRLNPCGQILWTKIFSDSIYDLSQIDLQSDQNQNIVIGGNYTLNSKRNPFILSLDAQANINFFYRLNTGTEDIAYTLDVNEQDQIYLYYKEDIGTVGPHSRNTVVKFDANGKLIWGKHYGFTAIWGEMYTSTEGGFIITNSREICKFDTDGDLIWNKRFDHSHNSQKHFSTPSGTVIFHKNSINFPSMLNRDGSVKWNGPIVNSFKYLRGVLRRNGNLLFIGYYGSKSAIMEVDSSDGSLLQLKLLQFENPTPYSIFDLDELSDSTIVYSGVESNSTFGSTFISRIDLNLANPICPDTLIKSNPTFDNATTFNAVGWNSNSINVNIVEPIIQVANYSFGKSTSNCAFSDLPILYLGNDTTLCPGQVLRLGQDIPQFDSYLWSTEQNSKSILVQKAGIYWLKALHGCDSLLDSIKISYHQIEPLNLGNDTSICKDDSIWLSTNGSIAKWSTGEIATSIKVGEGSYWASIITICGEISDSITVSYINSLKSPNLGYDTSLCFSDSLLLEVDPNANYIQWSNSSTTSSILVKKAGDYSVIIANACDTLKDTIQVEFYPEILLNAAVNPAISFVGDSIYFSADQLHPSNQLLWDLGDGNSSTLANVMHSYPKAGTYNVSLTLSDTAGCNAIKHFSLIVKELQVYIPNVFSPNADGIYDEFGIFGKHTSNIELRIYNRWGQVVFQSKDHKWLGRDQLGVPLPKGVYYYDIRFDQLGKARQKMQGSVSLLRN